MLISALLFDAEKDTRRI